ncbi:MAG TPA: Rrf2 family transcriptional regulator, partial [Nitrococcus sp.]|nr:Rrf2 family transcriptional regulator [Nitrococcus sp.]
MRLSAKSRYAVSALMHLAIHNQAGPVPLAEISGCQG